MKPDSTKGFTLVEVMIVITIIGIIAAIAVPNFITWLANNQLRDASQDLLSNVQHAKFEAIKRNRNVVINFAPVACAPTIPDPAGSYTIFVDDGSGGGTLGNNTREANEPVLRQETMRRGIGLCAGSVTFAFPAPAPIGFNQTGRPLGLNGGTVVLRNDNGRAYTLTLTATGNLALN